MLLPKGPPRNNVYKYDAGILASGKTPARSISAWIRNERATRPEVKRPSQIGKVISWRPLMFYVEHSYSSVPVIPDHRRYQPSGLLKISQPIPTGRMQSQKRPHSRQSWPALRKRRCTDRIISAISRTHRLTQLPPLFSSAPVYFSFAKHKHSFPATSRRTLGLT